MSTTTIDDRTAHPGALPSSNATAAGIVAIAAAAAAASDAAANALAPLQVGTAIAADPDFDPSFDILCALPLTGNRSDAESLRPLSVLTSASTAPTVAAALAATIGPRGLLCKPGKDGKPTTGEGPAQARAAAVAILRAASLGVAVRSGDAPAGALPVERSGGASGHVLQGDRPVSFIPAAAVRALTVAGFNYVPWCEEPDARGKMRRKPSETVPFATLQPATDKAPARVVVTYGWPLEAVAEAMATARIKREIPRKAYTSVDLTGMLYSDGAVAAGRAVGASLAATAAYVAVLENEEAAAAVLEEVNGRRACTSEKGKARDTAALRPVRRFDSAHQRASDALAAVKVGSATPTILRKVVKR